MKSVNLSKSCLSKFQHRLVLVAVCLFSFAFISNTVGAAQLINGGGATFPYPLYSKWFLDYNKVKPEIEINYQSMGSGAGINQLLARTIDFGASDAPMSDNDLRKSQAPILHFPTVGGAVVLSYNLEPLKGQPPLKLTGEVIADIYLGKIKMWNDPAIAVLNPGVNLPRWAIAVLYRSDSSGTTYVFTEYLTKVSNEWASAVGTTKSPKWPRGLGGKSNTGVTSLMKQTRGAIAYLEYTYAAQNKLAVASLKNADGEYIAPTLESTIAAADVAAKSIPKDFRVSLTFLKGKNVYPLVSLTYLLFYTGMPKQKAEAMREFLDWAYSEGQKSAGKYHYAPLPQSLLAKVKMQISQIKSKN